MSRSPRVSVVLPVYNGGAYLRGAIDSVLGQTFRDLEVIAVDDGSTDGSSALLDAVDDPRMRVLHQANQGLPAALNRGIALSRGEYVARQDHDDISHSERVAAQVAYLDTHPDCALLGTRADIYHGDRLTGRVHMHPLGDPALRFELLFDNPFVHSSVMIRRCVLDALGGYATDLRRQPPEDYELWSRIARGHRVANLAASLVQYREVPGSFSRARDPFPRLAFLSAENLTACLGPGVHAADVSDLVALMHQHFDAVSPSPSLIRMMAIVRDAAARIDPHRVDAELTAHVDARLALLKRRYLMRGRFVRTLRTAWKTLRHQLRALAE